MCGDVVPGYRGENDGNIPDTEKTLMKECSGLGDLVVRIARPEEKKVKEESRIHEETLMFWSMQFSVREGDGGIKNIGGKG